MEFAAGNSADPGDHQIGEEINLSNTARAYTLAAATDLYGSCGTEYRAVQATWTAVNVAGNDAACSATGNSSTLTIATTSSTPAGSYSITVTGTGTSVTRTATYSLTVTSGGGDDTAVTVA